MNKITNLPSLDALLSQNPNLQANVVANRFAQNAEISQPNGLPNLQKGNGLETIQIDKTSPTERVTAPTLLRCLKISSKE